MFTFVPSDVIDIHIQQTVNLYNCNWDPVSNKSLIGFPSN